MSSFLSDNEVLLRMAAFFGVLALVMGLEFRWPRRRLSVPRSKRWLTNLSLVVFNSVLLRILFPVAAVGVAAVAAENAWGLFNWLDLSVSIEMILAIVLLDLAVYVQHRLAHSVSILWRLHQVHHADPDFDTTTGLRFHPLEILLSWLYKAAVIILIGAPAAAVILFEIILNAMALFNHGNFYIPLPLDRVLRLLLVTPDVHRIHHSTDHAEQNCNFGFNLSLWDRLFSSWKEQPRLEHASMSIGLKKFHGNSGVTEFLFLLKAPLNKN